MSSLEKAVEEAMRWGLPGPSVIRQIPINAPLGTGGEISGVNYATDWLREFLIVDRPIFTARDRKDKP